MVLRRACGSLAAAVAASSAAAALAASSVVYVNFTDGTETFRQGADDAIKNQTSVRVPAPYPAYRGSESDRQKFVSALECMLAPYNVVLTTHRPAQGSYDMLVVGAYAGSVWPADGSSLSPRPDCGNRNHAQIVFTWGGAIDGAHVLGHSYGLGHVDVECDVMGLGSSAKGCPSGRWGFQDVIGSLVGGTACGGTTRDSHQDLAKILGAWPGGAKPDPFAPSGPCDDRDPPAVQIASPKDGAVLPGSFDVWATADDDCGLKNLHIVVGPDGANADSGFSPARWQLRDLPPGSHHIAVSAIDASGKEGRVAIDVTVDPSAPPPAAPADPTPPPASARCMDVTGPATGARGCGCEVGGSPAGSTCSLAAVFVPIAVAGSRRRRKRRPPADVERQDIIHPEKGRLGPEILKPGPNPLGRPTSELVIDERRSGW